jgi:hypothetical protein
MIYYRILPYIRMMRIRLRKSWSAFIVYTKASFKRFEMEIEVLFYR